MCLDIVHKHPSCSNRKGYKVGQFSTVFNAETGKNDKIFITADQHARLLVGQWIRDRYTVPIAYSYNNKNYPTGFHIFIEKSDAENWSSGNEGVVEVAFRKVVATGTQGRCKIVVAREIKIHCLSTIQVMRH